MNFVFNGVSQKNNSLLQIWELTPERHEYCEEYGGSIVEQVVGRHVKADLIVAPITAVTIAERAHREIISSVTAFNAKEEKNPKWR